MKKKQLFFFQGVLFLFFFSTFLLINELQKAIFQERELQKKHFVHVEYLHQQLFKITENYLKKDPKEIFHQNLKHLSAYLMNIEEPKEMIKDLRKNLENLISGAQDNYLAFFISYEKLLKQLSLPKSQLDFLFFFKVFFVIFIFSFLLLSLILQRFQKYNFKKHLRSLQDMQKGYFNIFLPIEEYSQELQPLTKEIIKLAEQLKYFEQLRVDRIQLEQKKFDILTQILKSPILIFNAEGKIHYLSNEFYSIVQRESTEFINKYYEETPLDKKLKELIYRVLETDEKIEQETIQIQYELDEDKNYEGFVSSYPIRGLGQDYYLVYISRN